MTQNAILQNYRYLRHSARTLGVVTNLGIYIIFEIKNKHTQPPYFLLIESFPNIRWHIVSPLPTNGDMGFYSQIQPGLEPDKLFLRILTPLSLGRLI